MEVLAVACKQLSGTVTFPGSGAVKRFVITTLINQVSTANIKFEAATCKKLGNTTGSSKYRNTISFGKNK